MFIAYTAIMTDGRWDIISSEDMDRILSADEIKNNLITNDIVTLGGWPSGEDYLDFKVDFFEAGKQYDWDPAEVVKVRIYRDDLPGYDEEVAAVEMNQRFVESPFGPFRYAVEGPNAFDTAEAAEAFEKTLNFYVRAPDVEDRSISITNARKEIERKFSVNIYPDL